MRSTLLNWPYNGIVYLSSASPSANAESEKQFKNIWSSNKEDNAYNFIEFDKNVDNKLANKSANKSNKQYINNIFNYSIYSH